MVNNILKEYEILREEINQKIGLHNSLLTFAITTVVGILTLALNLEQELLYLLPFCILIPITMRIKYYKSAMLKISAYMIVFLEEELDGINWETRNMLLIDETVKKQVNKNIVYDLRYYECFILSIICYILYCVNYLENRCFDLLTVFCVLIPFSLVALEWMITKHINSDCEERQKWIKIWKNLKKK